MSNNLGYDEGSEAEVASEDVGGVHWQRIRVAANTSSKTSTVSVSTTAVPLPATPLTARCKLVVQNPFASTGSLFIGDADLTASTGIEILPGGDFTFDVGKDLVLYALTASGTIVARVLELA